MKSGKTLTELAMELERQSQSVKDYIADTRLLEMTQTGELALENDTRHELPVTDTKLRSNIKCDCLGICAKFLR